MTAEQGKLWDFCEECITKDLPYSKLMKTEIDIGW